MSAFMVEDKTINRVVKFLARQLQTGEWPYLTRRFADAGFVFNGQFCEQLGKAMFTLNIRGVNARYGENEAQNFRELNYRYQPEATEEIQVYKSLDCWLYQCSEGDVPEDPFYALLQEAGHTLAGRIIRRLPRYDRAEWG